MRRLLAVIVILLSMSCTIQSYPSYSEDGTFVKEKKVLVAKKTPEPIDMIVAFSIVVGLLIVFNPQVK